MHMVFITYKLYLTTPWLILLLNMYSSENVLIIVIIRGTNPHLKS